MSGPADHTMELTKAFVERMRRWGLQPSGNHLLLAVSGGLDSVVLCGLCHQSGYPFSIAHCNFQLRGEESLRDENFVRELAERYAVPFYTERFDTLAYAEERKCSVQVAARELRYEWLEKRLEARGERREGSESGSESESESESERRNVWIVTAHHSDDAVETMAMHFFRGTGLAGLKGIPERQGKLIRPLLDFGKKELLQFAQEAGLSWVEDSSNATDKYTRNYFRHHILPAVEAVFPQARQSMVEGMQRFKEADELVQQAVALHRKKLLFPKGKEFHIPVEKLRKAQPLTTLTYELFREFGFSAAQVPEILQLLDSETGRSVHAAAYRVIRNRKWLILAPQQAEDSNHWVVPAAPFSFSTDEFVFSVKETGNLPAQFSTDNSVAWMDAASVQFPLLLRNWKAGDYFYPLGMKKKKKVARFLIDLKLSKTEKENVKVLVCGDRIIWVAGLRLDDRVKLKPSSQKALVLEFKNLYNVDKLSHR